MLWDRFGTTRCSGQHCAGRRGHRTGAPDGPNISGVPSLEAGPNPPCCHQASRRGPAPFTSTGPPATTRTVRRWVLSARITTSCSSRPLRRNRPVRSNHRVRAESAGPNGIHCRATHQRPCRRTATMPGTAQPRAIRTGPPTWCHRPQQLQRPVAQRIQNLSHRRRRAGGGRNHFPTAHRRIGRIADNDVKWPGAERVG